MITKFLQKLFPDNNKITAQNSSIAIGGDNSGNIYNVTITATNSNPEWFTSSLSSEVLVVPEGYLSPSAVGNLIDSQITHMVKNISTHPKVVIEQLDALYSDSASALTSGNRLRIKLNVALGHYQLGDRSTAADKFLEAYNEKKDDPKAIAYKVLALLLQKKYQEGFEFAKEELKNDPQNAFLAGFFIQCCDSIISVGDPLIYIPETLRTTEEVFIGLIHFHQRRDNLDQWIRLSHNGNAAFPENKYISYFLAQANIEEVLHDKFFQETSTLTEQQIERICSSINVLKEKWILINKQNSEKILEEDALIGCYLLIGYHLLKDIESIKSIAQSIISSERDFGQIIDHILRICFIERDFDTAQLILNKITTHTPLSAYYKFCFNLEKKNIKAIAKTSLDEIELIYEKDRVWCKVYQAIALLESAASTLPISEADFRKIIPSTISDIRGLLILSQCAKKHKFSELSDEIFNQAYQLLGPNNYIFERIGVASEAGRRKDFEKVIEVLSYLPFEVQVTNDEVLEMLAYAYVYLEPKSEKTSDFFRSLPSSCIKEPHISKLYAKFLFDICDYDEAEECYLYLYEINPSNLEYIENLCLTYLYQNHKAKIEDLVNNVDLRNLQGSYLQKMKLARVMADFKRKDDAIHFAYNILCQAPDDPDIQLNYSLLIMMSPKTDFMESSLINVGDWFEVIDENNKNISFVIEDDNSPNYFKNPIGLEHPIAKNAIGKKIGDEFYLEQNFGLPNKKWIIKKIKSKYLYAHYDILENFSTRFPNHPNGFTSIAINPSDLSPLEQMGEQKKEEINQLWDFYIKKKIPLEVLACIRKQNIIAIMEDFSYHKKPIITNTEVLKEREHQQKNLQQSTFTTIVLDSYSAWFLARNDLFPILKKCFEKIVIPATSLATIQDFNISFLNAYDGVIITIKNYCEVLPVVWDKSSVDIINIKLEKSKTVINLSIFNPTIAAKQDNALMLTEDLYYRQWVKTLFPDVIVSCSESIFQYALENNQITYDDYIKTVESLARSRHIFTKIDSYSLFRLLKQVQTEEKSIEQLKLIIENTIGYKHSDIAFQIKFSADFLINAWSNELSDYYLLEKITYATIKYLVQDTNGYWSTIIASLMMFPLPKKVIICIERWLVGHFLSHKDVLEKYNHLIEKRESIITSKYKT